MEELTNSEKLSGDLSAICGDAQFIHGDASGICGEVTYLCGNVSAIRSEVTDLRVLAVRGDVSGIGGDVSGLKQGQLGDVTGLIVPVVPHIDAAILAELARDEHNKLDMKRWHSCRTTHCRGGWAIHLAGKAGAKLEDQVGSQCAAALIYAASRPGRPMPKFCATEADALDDIRACAALDPLP